MNGWYTTKELNSGTDVAINLDSVQAIVNDHENALFIMNSNSMKVSIKSVEKYENVLRKLFGPDEPEEGEDDGKPRDPSGFNGILPM